VAVGRPGVLRRARGLLATGSPWRAVLVRVGVAALLVGALGAAVGLDHGYWAVAGAVLVLCQGLGWAGTLERAVLRLGGTWIGLLLAAAVLAARPAGIALAATIAVLQCAAQLLLPRNYGLGVIAVTPLALAIGSGGDPADLGELLLARGVATLVGCGIGVLVFLAVRPGAALPDPRALVAATLREAARVVAHLAASTTAGPAARSARHDLDRRVLALADAHHVCDLAAPVRPDVGRTVWWPALDATHRLAHRVLAADRAADTGGPAPALAEGLADELAALARWVDGAAGLPGSAVDAGFLAPELATLRATLPARW
jgi:uncharacterized membrane protein YccC